MLHVIISGRHDGFGHPLVPREHPGSKTSGSYKHYNRHWAKANIVSKI